MMNGDNWNGLRQISFYSIELINNPKCIFVTKNVLAIKQLLIKRNDKKPS